MLFNKPTKYLLLILSLCLLSSCTTNIKELTASSTQVRMLVEQRDFTKDTIKKYRFFDKGLVEIFNYHSTAADTKIFQSKFIQLDAKSQELLGEIYFELLETKHSNEFLWQKDREKVKSIIKVEFIQKQKPDLHLPGASLEPVPLAKSYFYYPDIDQGKNYQAFEKLLSLMK